MLAHEGDGIFSDMAVRPQLLLKCGSAYENCVCKTVQGVWAPRPKKTNLLCIMNANKRPAVGLFPATSKTRDTGRCGFSTGIFRGNFVYGRGWDKPYSWKERLFGMEPYANCFGWVDDKVAAIGKNKFIVCYENMIKEGYVSEKIFLEPT